MIWKLTEINVNYFEQKNKAQIPVEQNNPLSNDVKHYAKNI